LLVSHTTGVAQEGSGDVTDSISSPVMGNDSTTYTNSGSIKLTWESRATNTDEENTTFELERATQPDFADASPYYTGPDLATYISGLANGKYYFRIREIAPNGKMSAWSAPVEVVVEHHSLSLAFTLFGIGGLVFILTVFVVLRGANRTVDPDESAQVHHESIGS
jgi:hypothetical protein